MQFADPARAKLVEGVNDIVEEFKGWQPKVDVNEKSAPIPDTIMEPKVQQILNAVGYDPVSVDGLALCCPWPMEELLAALTTLEVMGLIEQQNGSYQRLV